MSRPSNLPPAVLECPRRNAHEAVREPSSILSTESEQTGCLVIQTRTKKGQQVEERDAVARHHPSNCRGHHLSSISLLTVVIDHKSPPPLAADDHTQHTASLCRCSVASTLTHRFPSGAMCFGPPHCPRPPEWKGRARPLATHSTGEWTDWARPKVAEAETGSPHAIIMRLQFEQATSCGLTLACWYYTLINSWSFVVATPFLWRKWLPANCLLCIRTVFFTEPCSQAVAPDACPAARARHLHHTTT